MAIAYFDSSALVKLLVDEAESDMAADVWADVDVVATNRLAYPEVRSALAAARRNARLGKLDERRAWSDWVGYWSNVRVVELTEPVAEHAATLASEHVLSGADAVHLASALTLADADPILVTWDRRLRTAAVDVGLRVVPRDLA